MKAIDWLLVVAVLVFVFSGSPTVFGPSSAVVVYESAEYIPEPYVVGALADIESRIVDQHITTGDKETPAYLSDAIDAAKKKRLTRAGNPQRFNRKQGRRFTIRRRWNQERD